MHSGTLTEAEPITGLPRGQMVFDRAPRNVYWECTIACDLACHHCRASAVSEADPQELTHEQGEQLIDSIAELGSMLVLTGGDPLKRADLFELITYARERHVPVSITPSITPLLTYEALSRLAKSGVAAVGISLDAPRASVHDEMRGIPGTFDRTREVLNWCRELGLTVQVNTTVTRFTAPHLPAMLELLSKTASPPVRRWALFILVPVGRGTSLAALSSEELEELFGWVWKESQKAPFHMGTVEAPQYRRFALQQLEQDEATLVSMASPDKDKAFQRLAQRLGGGIRDGNGVTFVSHTGDVYPAGFMPLPIGNVKERPLTDLYRNSKLMQQLRDPNTFNGKCGRCSYRWVCGGSRARAFTMTGDPFGSDPACGYEPAQA